MLARTPERGDGGATWRTAERSRAAAPGAVLRTGAVPRTVLPRERSAAREGEAPWGREMLGDAARGGAVDRDTAGDVRRTGGAEPDPRSEDRRSTLRERSGIAPARSRVDRIVAALPIRSGRLVTRCDEALESRAGDADCALDDRIVPSRRSTFRWLVIARSARGWLAESAGRSDPERRSAAHWRCCERVSAVRAGAFPDRASAACRLD